MASDEHVQKFLEIEESASQIIVTLERLDEKATGYETALYAVHSLCEELVSVVGRLREVAAQVGSLEGEAKQALGQAAEQISAAVGRLESAIANAGSGVQDMQRELAEALSQVATKQEVIPRLDTMESVVASADSATQDMRRELTEALSQVATKQEVASCIDTAQSLVARDLKGLKRIAVAGFVIVGILGVASLLVAIGVVS